VREDENLPDAGRGTVAFCVLMQDDRAVEAFRHLVSVTNGRDVVNSISDEQNRVVGGSIEMTCVRPLGSSVPLSPCQYIGSHNLSARNSNLPECNAS
jgi:hypothetical protein